MNRMPKLYFTAETLARLTDSVADNPVLQPAYQRVCQQSEIWCQTETIDVNWSGHNSLLLRARENQRRVITLLVRWQQTRYPRFRDAVMRYIKKMGTWEYWSWIAMREGDSAPDAIFDLSYGENSATLGIAFDWLYPTLSPAEKQIFLDIALKWPFASAKKNVQTEEAWWYGMPKSNWNTVCSGGLGLLCLAMIDEIAEAPALLDSCEKSIRPFFDYLEEQHGGWGEGLGYWNYAFRYAFMYLLSWENSFARPHPLLNRQSVATTLEFPLLFAPYQLPCGFGDSNKWAPMPFHFRMAEYYDNQTLMESLKSLVWDKQNLDAGHWPNDAELLAFYPAEDHAAPKTQFNYTRFFPGLDWAMIADKWPEPGFYFSIRGGTTRIPHTHRDLLSFNTVVGRELILANQTTAEYLDTTFSPRREELFEMSPFSKNTVFLNGIGIAIDSELESTEVIREDGWHGLRMVATSAMGKMRDGAAANFCGRLLLRHEKNFAVIADYVETQFPARFESRLHTPAQVNIRSLNAFLQGQESKMTLAFGANVPGCISCGKTCPTTPTVAPANVIRWCTTALHEKILLVTVIFPKNIMAVVTVTGDRAYEIEIETDEWKQILKIDDKLKMRLQE